MVERAPVPRDGGQAVNIRGAAIDVAEPYGDLGRAAAGAHAHSRDDVRRRHREASGQHERGLRRGRRRRCGDSPRDLVGILYEAARSGAEYIFGDSVTGIAGVPGAVEVTFERAAPRSFDLVIGADGLHSKVRAVAFGPESQFARHLGMYLSVFTVANDMGLDHWQLIHVSPGKSVTVTSARGNTEARAIFFFASPPLEYGHRDTGQQQELLETAFAGQGWQIPRLLAAMRDTPDSTSIPSASTAWTTDRQGRVTLVATRLLPFATVGQGAASRWSGLRPGRELQQRRRRPWRRLRRLPAPDAGLRGP